MTDQPQPPEDQQGPPPSYPPGYQPAFPGHEAAGDQPQQSASQYPPYPPHQAAPQQAPGYPPPGYAPPQYPPPYQGQYAGYPPPYQGQYAGYPPPYPYGPPAPYGYPVAPAVPRPSFPHDRPREYHQMLRTWTYEWWRSLVGLILMAVGFMIVLPILALPIALVGSGETTLMERITLQELTPSGLLYLNVTLGSAILVCWLVIRVMHGMRPRWLSSVVPRLRWDLVMIYFGLSAVALVASISVGLLVPETGNGAELTGELNEFTATTAWLLLIVLLTTPFQAAGEEYIFRGYMMQAIGSFVEKEWWKWVTIFITAFLFACAHGLQNFPLFFDRFMFGFIAGWLVIKTGGLEAAIAMHVLNNYLAFGFALAIGDVGETLTVAEVSWWNIPVTLTQAGVYAVLVLWVARRRKIQTKTAPPGVREPVPVG